MTAVSAFAPTPRNRFLRYVVSVNTGTTGSTTPRAVGLAFLLLILSFWNRSRQSEKSSLHVVLSWIKWLMMNCCWNETNPTLLESAVQQQQQQQPLIRHDVDGHLKRSQNLLDAIRISLQRWVNVLRNQGDSVGFNNNDVNNNPSDNDQCGTSRPNRSKMGNNDDEKEKGNVYCRGIGRSQDHFQDGEPFYDYDDNINDGEMCPPKTISTTTSTMSTTSTTTILENRQLIQQVLLYWFGQYPPDHAQRKLWMIADSSVELRTRVDAEIAHQFTLLLLDLSTTTSSSSSSSALGERSRRWKQWTHDTSLYGYHGKLAAIVVLDQMARHVRRYYTTTSNGTSRDNDHNPLNTTEPGELSIDPILLRLLIQQRLPDQHVLDQLAYQASVKLQKEHKVELACGMIPLPMHVFALMPLRHANTIATVQQVQDDIEENMAGLQPQMQALIQRFRKATNRRMAILQDEARRGGGGGQQRTTLPPSTQNWCSNGNKIQNRINYHRDTCSNSVGSLCPDNAKTNDKSKNNILFADRDDDILEHTPFEADMSLSQQHVVHKAIMHFLANRNIFPRDHSDSNEEQHRQERGDKKNQTKDASSPSTILDNANATSHAAPVIVSLSGGVDSMVVATVLAHLRDKCNYPHLQISAVHIDYANRPESGAEADYCARYCRHIGITSFFCRRIEEVTRGTTARDEYERRAREIRFQEYRSAISKAQEQHDSNMLGARHITAGVVLGHHRGDLRENVLSNAHKGCGPLDLSGMTEVSQNDGVTIYRPLLSLEKTAIFDYAHKFGVPYFKDTTPHWSTRGKLRNKLLPLLEEIYGEGSMNNLSALATESDEARSLLYDTVLGPFMKQVSQRPMGIFFETAPWKLQGLYFWKLALREVLHSAGFGMFKDKSVASFCERIQATKLRAGWLQCRRDYAVYLEGDGRVYVFYPDSFPWCKQDAFTSCIGQAVPFGEEHAVTVGPWSVISHVVTPSEASVVNALLATKAVQSMECFMDGHIEYYLRVPTLAHDATSPGAAPRPLVIISEFSRGTRPLAWKSCDLKIQSTLPILGNDETALSAFKDSGTNKSPQNDFEKFQLAKVTLKLSKQRP